MTLEEWEARAGITAYKHATGQRLVHDTADLEATGERWRLFRLDDYAVCGVRAGVIWLWKRQGESPFIDCRWR